MSIKAAIDLLWVRPKQVGGIESYIRNIMDGLMETNEEFVFYLLVSIDNADSFKHYENDERFVLHVCNVKSSDVKGRIVWQNFNLGRVIRSLGLNICFEPYYCKPILGVRGISFLTTIHDLQAIHYPEYFSKGKVLWMKFAWKSTVRLSKIVIATSEFVKRDIVKQYKPNEDKVKVLNIPITVDTINIKDAEYIRQKYNVEPGEYYFSVSSLLPHKNVGVLLEMMKLIVERSEELPCKLIVSGVGGKSRDELDNRIKEYGLECNILLTQFIENEERNALYKYSKAFLFPSVFEGFGMPPIEAMLFGVPVITTRKTSLEEVTQGKAIYVEDPYNPEEWIDKAKHAECDYQTFDFDRYNKKMLAIDLLNMIKDLQN